MKRLQLFKSDETSRIEALLRSIWALGLLFCAWPSASFAQEDEPQAPVYERAHEAVHLARRTADFIAERGERGMSAWALAQRRISQAHQEALVSGRRIMQIELICTLNECQDTVQLDSFKDIAGLYVGMTYDSQALTLARQRLLKTGLFESNIITRAKLLPKGGVRLEIYAQAAVLIRSITFTGLDPPPFRDDLQKILIYREGQAYSGDQEKRRVQLLTMRELYEREGYFETRINLVTRKNPKTPQIVDLEFNIEKGRELRICKMGLRGLTVLSYNEARDLLLSEISLIERRLSLVLPRFTSSALRQGQEKLIREYRRMGYYQARVVDKDLRFSDDGCVEVLIDVAEGPRWELKFEGASTILERELREVIPFAETGYVDRQSIELAAKRIERLYMTRGYAFAAVSAEEVRQDRFSRQIIFKVQEGDKVEIRQIVFKRNTHPSVVSPPRSIPGLSDDELIAQMGTRPFGLFATGGYLQYEELLSDFGRIEQVYRELGFLQAVVSSFEIERIERGSGLRVSLTIDEGPRTVVERVEIKGNRRLPLGLARSLLQVKGRPTPSPFSSLLLRADSSRLMQRYASLGYPMASIKTSCFSLSGEELPCEAPSLPERCLVRSASMLIDAPTPAQITAVNALGEDEGRRARRELERQTLNANCQWVSAGNKTRQARQCRRLKLDAECVFSGGVLGADVRAVHRVFEGPFVRVGEVLLRGNFDTESALILRELPLKSGDSFDVKKLLTGQANLRSLGLFDSVSVEAIGLDQGAAQSEEATAALVVSVEESEYQSFDFGTGLQGRDLLNDSLRRMILLGEIEYNNRNFLGLGQRFRPRLLLASDLFQLLGFGGNSNLNTLGESVRRVDYLVGAELVYSDPRFLKGLASLDKLSLTISPYYLLDLLGVSNNRLQREEAGLRSELRKELVELIERLFVTFGGEAKWIATRSPTNEVFLPNGEPLFSPRRTIAKMFVEVAFDRRDSPLNPTEGYYLEFSPQWVSGNASEGVTNAAIRDSFLRLSWGSSVYTSFWNKSLVFGQSLRLGQIVPINDRERPVPDDERYILGGVSSVRGFLEGGIATSTTGGLGQLRGGEFMMNTSSELRYPILQDIGLWAATFMDVGLLADCFDDNNSAQRTSCYKDAFPAGDRLSKVRMSTGLGIRYLIAGQIPLLLDYAVLLNRQPGESFSNLHFNVGYTF